jgi:hypothetical protein
MNDQENLNENPAQPEVNENSEINEENLNKIEVI